MPVAILPDFPYPRVAVIADAGDMAIDSVLVSITRPLERAASSVPGVTRVRSRTARGSVEISVDFEWKADLFQALTYLRGSVDAVRPELPPGTALTIERQDPSSFPVIGYSMTSSTVDPATLREAADLLVAPTLGRLDGIYRVLVQGGDVREFAVTVRPEALAAHAVSVEQVRQAIEDTNVVSSVGRFDRQYLKYLVVGTAELRDGEDVLNAVLKVEDGTPIRVRDVADVHETSEEKITAATANGKPAVLFSILKQPGASTVDVSDRLKSALKDLAPALPAGVEVRPFYDESDLLRESIGSVRDAILIGALLSIAVLFLFLGNWRSSVVVLATLPVTVLTSMLVLRACHQTLNLMTLGGFAVGLGLIIDDVVVTVENIHRRKHEGHPIEWAARVGIEEITKPLVGSTITRICVFLPLLAVSGITGAFFAPLALTLTILLIVSIILALTLAPALSKRLERREAAEWKATHGFIEWLQNAYERLLRLALTHRWQTLALAVFFGVLCMFLVRGLPTGFMPEMDEGGFVLDYYTPDGTSLAETDRQCRLIEEILMAQPEVDAYSRRTGMELGFFATEQNIGDFAVRLKPKSQRKRGFEEITADLRDEIAEKVPGIRVEFIQIVQDRVRDMAGEPNPIDVKIFGDDPEKLREIADRVCGIVGDTAGVVEPFNGVTNSGPELTVRVDPGRAARAGFTPKEVVDALSTAMLGSGETVVRRGERLIRVTVKYPPALRRSEEQVRALRLTSPNGQSVALASIADVAEGPGTPEQEREDQKPVIGVTAQLEGRDLGSAVAEVRQKISAQVQLPEGYSIQYGGLFEAQRQSFHALMIVFLLGIGLVLVADTCQYESFAEPIALFVSAMLSLVGVVVALFLTKTALNASSFTGTIMNFGMVMTNGTVLMDYIRDRTKKGMRLEEAIIEAGRVRVRPVLMTSLIAILALLPLALGIGAGAEMQKPLAIAVIGGLIASPFFALLVGPVILVLLRRMMGGKHFEEDLP
jgi:CzcA family heavy metal efflux pump